MENEKPKDLVQENEEELEPFVVSGAEAVRDVFMRKQTWEHLDKMLDKVIGAKKNIATKNFTLYLTAVILRYVLTGFVSFGIYRLLIDGILSKEAAIPIITAIVASLFVPPPKSH